VLCFWRSELYARDLGEHGRWGSLKAINALCFQDPLFFGYTHIYIGINLKYIFFTSLQLSELNHSLLMC